MQRASLPEVAKAMCAMREERKQVENQTGIVIAECWLCSDAVFGDDVPDAYAKLTTHIEQRHQGAK